MFYAPTHCLEALRAAKHCFEALRAAKDCFEALRTGSPQEISMDFYRIPMIVYGMSIDFYENAIDSI